MRPPPKAESQVMGTKEIDPVVDPKTEAKGELWTAGEFYSGKSLLLPGVAERMVRQGRKEIADLQGPMGLPSGLKIDRPVKSSEIATNLAGDPIAKEVDLKSVYESTSFLGKYCRPRDDQPDDDDEPSGRPRKPRKDPDPDDDGGGPGGPGRPGGASGGGGGGPPPPNDLLMKLIERLVVAEEKRADVDSRAQSRRDDQQYKVESSLPELSGVDPLDTIKKLQEFERALDDAKIKSRYMWVRFFRSKLTRVAKTWVEAPSSENLESD
jgi:hypothetical protein